jgi:prephenate dehydrogenase
LFSGAVCAITPGITSSENSEVAVYEFWEGLGCRCIKIEASMHDEMVAKVSHLPHLISSALAITSLDDKSDDVKLAGPGIKGMTRIALGSPDMWAEILLQNKDSVEKVLSEHIDSISEVLKHLKDGDHEEVLEFLIKARENRINCFPSD